MSTYTGVTNCQKNSPVFLAHPVMMIMLDGNGHLASSDDMIVKCL